MNSRVLAIAAVCAVVVISAAFLFLSRGAPAPADAPVADAAPAAPAPSPEPAAPEAAPSAAAAPRPRAARPDAAPAPAEAAPAVEAVPDAGTLRIDSDVPGAQVFIDRQFIGTTPVTAANVKPGTHQLNVSAEGFEGVARSIEVEPGARDLMIRFKEVRLDARVAVVHKHRIGSCRGELVATAQGLQVRRPTTRTIGSPWPLRTSSSSRWTTRRRTSR